MLVTALLSILGPSNKKSSGDIRRRLCYEIGGDVFSLAGLECMVFRGNSSMMIHSKQPFVKPPKKSKSYIEYSLDFADPRINFILNYGCLSSVSAVPVYTPVHLENQMLHSCCLFLRRQVYVDAKKRTVVLPKVCDVYRKGFGQGDPMSCLLFSLQLFDESTQPILLDMISDDVRTSTTKFHSACDNHCFMLILNLSLI